MRKLISLLARIFIKDKDNYSSASVRSAYGLLCSIVGIVLNIILFGAKYFAGVLSGSVSITADSFNNLSDAASSFVTLLGFKLASQKPHSDHPFGHGRFEYISGLAVSFLIILMGIEVLKTSIAKIATPSDTEFSVVSAVILLLSVGVKLYMYIYNRNIGKKLDSAAMRATAFDCFGDMAATGAVLVSGIIGHFTNVNIDGWCGAAVSLFILWSGIRAAGETINPLLGQAPSEEFVSQVQEIVCSHEQIIGIHDLVVHDYGPGRRMISLHGEVPGNMNVFELHDVIDHIEVELYETLGCEAVIHMDPIDTENPLLPEISSKLKTILRDIHPGLSFHDLRTVTGPSHTNIIFDLAVPYDVKMPDGKIVSTVKEQMRDQMGDRYFCVIKAERLYTK